MRERHQTRDAILVESHRADAPSARLNYAPPGTERGRPLDRLKRTCLREESASGQCCPRSTPTAEDSNDKKS